MNGYMTSDVFSGFSDVRRRGPL